MKMSKTVTLRLKEPIYQMIKTAASGEKRSISSLLEYAALLYLSSETFVSNKEMKEILDDAEMMKTIKTAEREIKEGNYKIV
jgi:hypothetical protein